MIANRLLQIAYALRKTPAQTSFAIYHRFARMGERSGLFQGTKTKNGSLRSCSESITPDTVYPNPEPTMSNSKDLRIKEGLPHPCGATWDRKGTNFAIFSAHATKIELCLFDDRGERELNRVALPEYTNQIWHGFLPDIGPGTVYGYRVH